MVLPEVWINFQLALTFVDENCYSNEALLELNCFILLVDSYQPRRLEVIVVTPCTRLGIGQADVNIVVKSLFDLDFFKRYLAGHVFTSALDMNNTGA